MSTSTRLATCRLLILLVIATSVHFALRVLIPESELSAVIGGILMLCWVLTFGYAFVSAFRRFSVGRIRVLRFGLPIVGALLSLAASAVASAGLWLGVHSLLPVR
jgi:predicted membrane protein